jgi:hypothetical protein
MKAAGETTISQRRLHHVEVKVSPVIGMRFDKEDCTSPAANIGYL